MGFEVAYCHCEDLKVRTEVHGLQYRNALLREYNKYQVGFSKLSEEKSKLEKCENRVIELNQKHKLYTRSKEDFEKQKIKNEILMKDLLLAREIGRTEQKILEDNKKIEMEKERRKKEFFKSRDKLLKIAREKNKEIIKHNHKILDNERKIEQKIKTLEELDQEQIYLKWRVKLVKEELQQMLNKITKKGYEWDVWMKENGEGKKGSSKNVNRFELLGFDSSSSDQIDNDEDFIDEKTGEWIDVDKLKPFSLKEKEPVKKRKKYKVSIEDKAEADMLIYQNQKLNKEKEDKDKIKNEILAEINQVQRQEYISIHNQYTIMFEDKEKLAEAEEMTRAFLSNSKNLILVKNFDLHNAKDKKIRELKNERIYEYGYCDKITTKAINEAVGSHVIKKYKIRDFKKLLILMILCYKNNLNLDLSYVKKTFGFKRCQSKYLLKGISLSLNRMKEILIKSYIKNI